MTDRSQKSEVRSQNWLAAMLLAVFTMALLQSVVAQPADEILKLLPPHAEIPPTFWEQHGVQVVIGGLALLGLLILLIRRLARPLPVLDTPPEARARWALEALHSKPEDGEILSRVSQILRHYFGAVYPLPPGELTTTDFCRAADNCPAIGAELAAATGEFLHECDRRKFAPIPPAGEADAVVRALALVEKSETRRAQFRAAVPTAQPK